MFTGMVEELGALTSLSLQGESARLSFSARRVVESMKLGDSIAVNGVCLTVASFTAREFTADVMPETLRKTNLTLLKPGSRVNLERALALGDRVGGHLVSGHVDGVGRIIDERREGNACVFRCSMPPELARYTIPQGSIAVDGISLTLADVSRDHFSVSVIPHTAAMTTLGFKVKGDTVNLEADMIGKYVARLLAQLGDQPVPGLNWEFLKAHGFTQ